MTERKQGRQTIELDWAKFDAILYFGAGKRDAAEIMGCSEDTLERNIRKKYDVTFAVYRDKKQAKLRLNLVQKAVQQCLKDNPNTALLIFLLKNKCGFSDQPEVIEDLEEISYPTVEI